MRRNLGVRCQAALAAVASLVGVSCAEEPPALPPRADLSIGGEVFHIMCKRVARDAHREDANGFQFNGPCDGQSDVADGEDDRLAALVERRREIVEGLDQVFGEKSTRDGAEFASGELDDFLAKLIPFYDPPDELTPKSTRALAAMMRKLADRDDERAVEVLENLERVAPRVGYRPIEHVLGAIKPMVSYPGLDDLSREFLGLLGKDGDAHDINLQMLRAGALELAEPSDSEDTPASQRTLRAATDLLFQTDDAFGTSDAKLWVVRRDDRGFALPAGGTVAAPFVDEDGDGLADLERGRFVSTEGSIASPFRRAGIDDDSPRDEDGRALGANNRLLFDYLDANHTLLAALLREQLPLVEREDPGEPSTVEKLARGLRPMLGPTVDREENFGAATFEFSGPDVDEGPIFDLVHAVAMLARYEETDRLIELLEILMTEHESEAAGPVYAALRIDERSDDHPEAKLMGLDGEGSPSEFWDDLIQVGVRMLERPGMLEAVLRSFAQPDANPNTALMAKFMRYKDQVSYNGAPIMLQADGTYSDADAATMNSPIEHALSEEVDRTKPDIGMNRSLFQRLISTIHATNGAPNCNKQGANLNVIDPTTGTPLSFPNPTAKPATNLPDPISESLARVAIDSLCAHQSGQPTGTYDACVFVRQANGAESHMRSMLGKATITLKDEQLKCLDGEGLAGDLSATQEANAQITGFTLTPTPTAIARYIAAPRTKFVTDLFDPFPTIHGAPVVEFEPDMMFALELTQPDVLFDGQPQSFLTASIPLLKAFDDHEFFEGGPEDPVATHGYMFAELLATLHKHWPSHRDTNCPATVEAGNEGCSQSVDSAAPFYAPQSNLVSYEPLLIEALEEEKLGEILQRSSKVLEGITIGDKDGVTVLADFLARVITPDPELTYRDGRTYAKTNTCVEITDATTGEPACAEGVGRIIEGVPPLYLLLDALNGIDEMWEDNGERHDAWLEAREVLVDQFLEVERNDADPAAPTYRLKNRRGRVVALKLLPWVRGRLAAHPLDGDRLEWAADLDDRLASVLGHPAMAIGLDLLDVLWDSTDAAAEFAKVSAYLMDEGARPDAFAGLLVAATDTLMLMDRDPDLTPLVRFASLALAPNAFEALDDGDEPEVEESVAYTGLELTRNIANLEGPSPSTISKILKNAVLPNDDGESPLEIIIDASAEVNRRDPTEPRDTPLEEGDYRSVFTQVEEFLSDPDRGMERLYKVIRGRSLAGQVNQ